MPTVADGSKVTDGDGGLAVTRRAPWVGWSLSALVTVGALLAFDPGPYSDRPMVIVVFGVMLSALTLPARVQRRAQSRLVRHLRRRLVLTPERAGSYRDRVTPAALRIDGRERPLADLRRVAVERQVFVELQPDGTARDVPIAGNVALVFGDGAVVVRQAAPLDEVAALAGRLAGAAALEVSRLADVATTTVPKDPYGYELKATAINRAVNRFQVAMPMQANPGHDARRYGGHLSLPRAAAMALVASAALLATVVATMALEMTPYALTRGGRWLCAVGEFASWVAGDAVALLACAAIARRAALARARDVYEFGRAPV